MMLIYNFSPTLITAKCENYINPPEYHFAVSNFAKINNFSNFKQQVRQRIIMVSFYFWYHRHLSRILKLPDNYITFLWNDNNNNDDDSHNAKAPMI